MILSYKENVVLIITSVPVNGMKTLHFVYTSLYYNWSMVELLNPIEVAPKE
jgi:hypothetical protein